MKSPLVKRAFYHYNDYLKALEGHFFQLLFRNWLDVWWSLANYCQGEGYLADISTRVYNWVLLVCTLKTFPITSKKRP